MRLAGTMAVLAAMAVLAGRAHAATFPLEVSANGRYLVGHDGRPFRMQSDAAWLSSTRATADEIDPYLADRKARGFNTFVLQAMVSNGYSGHEPTNAAGNQPFLTPGDLSTPNEAFFSFVDSIIDKAAAQGMLVLFFYTYLGFEGGDEGWWSVVNQPQNTQAACLAWGRWLGNRYKNRANIIWMVGGDFSPPEGEGLTRTHRILEGIRAAGATQLAGAQWGNPDTLATDQPGFSHGPSPATADINIETFYGYGAHADGLTYVTADRAWHATPTLPAILFEPVYENDRDFPSSARESIRAYQYWAVLAGSTAGQCFGVRSVWNWLPDWRDKLNSPGSQDMQRAFSLFDSMPWQDMVPSGSDAAGGDGRTLIVSGAGTSTTQIVASSTPYGSWLIAYVPPTGTGEVTFAVDLRGMSRPARGRWWNPTSGAYTDITGGARTLDNTAEAQSFTTPGDNGTGTNDWVLVLDTGEASPGPGSAAGGDGGTAAGTAGQSPPGGGSSDTAGCGCAVRPGSAGRTTLLLVILTAAALSARRGGGSRRSRPSPAGP